jgi:adenylate kinase
MEKKPFNLILLGDPAAGKATQAARLVKKYHFYDFDMGKEVRKPSVRVQYRYAQTTGMGKLTPTAVVRKILRRVIRTVPVRQGILFDGHPKMIGEAKLVAKWLAQYKRSDPFVLYLGIPVKEVLCRAEKRKVYQQGHLIRRDDDVERAIKNREQYYREQISRVVSFFKKRYAFKRISGLGSRAEVWKRIDAAISHHASS